MKHPGLVDAFCARCGKQTGWKNPTSTAEVICHDCSSAALAAELAADYPARVPLVDTKEEYTA